MRGSHDGVEHLWRAHLGRNVGKDTKDNTVSAKFVFHFCNGIGQLRKFEIPFSILITFCNGITASDFITFFIEQFIFDTELDS